MQQLIERSPDVIVLANFTGGYRDYVLGPTENFEEAWIQAAIDTRRKLPSGAAIVVLGDTPEWQHQAPATCLSDNLEDIAPCKSPIEEIVDPKFQQLEREAALASDATFISTVDFLCSLTCSPIIGNQLVYRDRHHITATFSRTLANTLGRRVQTSMSVGN